MPPFILSLLSYLGGKAVSGASTVLSSLLGGITNVLTTTISHGLTSVFTKTAIQTAATHGFEGLLQHGISDALKGFEESVGAKDLEIGAKDFSPYGSIGYWDKIYSTAKDMNRELGIAGQLGRNIQESFQGALGDFARLGIKAEEVTKSYKAFITETGRNQELTSSELTRFAELQAVFGEGAEKIFAAYSDSGVSIKDSSKQLKTSLLEANRYGINSKVVFDNIAKNARFIDKLSFANGRKGLEQMAIAAEKTKLSMESAEKLADGILDKGIEGAIEMGAELQVLGGRFAQLNAFDLYQTSRNNPEKFGEMIKDAVKGMAQLNRETGEIEINAHSMSLIREFSKTMGIAREEVSLIAKNVEKEASIKGLFDNSIQSAGEFQEILTKVAGAARFDTDINDWVVSINGIEKRISQLDKERDLANLGTLDVGVTAEDSMSNIVNSNETLVEAINRLIDEFKRTYISTASYKAMENFVKPFANDSNNPTLQWLGEKFKGLGDIGGANFNNLLTKVGAGDVKGSLGQVGSNLYGSFTGIMSMFGDMFVKTITFVFSEVTNFAKKYVVDAAAETSGGVYDAVKGGLSDLKSGISNWVLKTYWGVSNDSSTTTPPKINSKSFAPENFNIPNNTQSNLPNEQKVTIQLNGVPQQTIKIPMSNEVVIDTVHKMQNGYYNSGGILPKPSIGG